MPDLRCESFVMLQAEKDPTMSIMIDPDLEARLKARAHAEGISVETYVERIARDDENAERELESLALEGLESGASLLADDRFWAEKREQLSSRSKS
jgi:hypothetical protein